MKLERQRLDGPSGGKGGGWKAGPERDWAGVMRGRGGVGWKVGVVVLESWWVI